MAPCSRPAPSVPMHAAGTMLATSVIVVGMGLGMALVPGSAMRVAMADDEAVAGAVAGVAAVAEAGDEPQVKADGKQRQVLFLKEGPVARHLRFGWDGRRMVLEDERLPLLQEFITKHEQRVAAAVTKQAIDAAIEAFRLTEDADYLKSLLDGAPADDAAVIRSRLDKLATGK